MDESSCSFDRARSRPAKITKGNEEGGLLPEDAVFFAELGAAPLSLLFLLTASLYHEVVTVAQQAQVNADRAEAEASRPGEG
jgi:hypothetical protein